MNKYKEFSDRVMEEVNALPLGFAFSNKQFEEMMNEWGLTVDDTDKIYKLGISGGFYRKEDSKLIKDTLARHEKEFQDEIAADPDGTNFIYDMFVYELGNHEYSYTGDIDETLDALGFTIEDIKNDERLEKGLLLAMKSAK
jgi:hypothetical protein